MDWSTILISIAGAVIASILTPFSKWYFENKKENRNERLKLISDLRNLLEHKNPKDKEFLNSSIYSRIRPYFSEKLVKKLETNSSITISPNNNREIYLNSIEEELVLIEDLWKMGLPKKKKRRNHKIQGDVFTISSVNSSIIKPKSK